MPNPFDQFDAPPAPAPQGNAFDQFDAPAQPYTVTDQITRGLGLSASALAKGITGTINMVPDAMTAAYDWARNPHIPSWKEINPFSPEAWPSNTPSAYINRAIDQFLPTPQTTAEKVASVGLGMEGGAMLPNLPVPDALMPGGAKAPAEFVSPRDLQAKRLAEGLKRTNDEGYVVPPSTTNPTTKNKLLETIAGKEATQNEARVVNQQARNAGAATDLGLKPEVFTPDAVQALKTEAGQAIEQAKSVPRFQTSDSFRTQLDKVVAETRGANADFPGATNPDVEKLVDTYRSPSFTGQSGVSAIRTLRVKADDAFRQGNSEMGIAYKGVSRALEDELERGAQQAGGQYTNLVQQLRTARKTYAQASTVLDAMDPNGNVSGQKLAAAWNRNEPLSGNVLTAAEHAANYPKANLPANSSNISHLNMYTAPLAAMEGYHLGGWKGAVAGAALPFARGGARSYLLSGMGQAGARPPVASTLAAALAQRFPSTVAGAVNAAQ